MKKQWLIYSGIGVLIFVALYFVNKKYQEKKAKNNLEASLTKAAKEGRTITIQTNKAL